MITGIKYMSVWNHNIKIHNTIMNGLHLDFDISANALEIKGEHSLKSIV
jgi:hypothetical protein